MPPAKPAAPRKRNRKRKRRVASSESSSSSEDEATTSGSENESTLPRKPAPLPTQQKAASKSESEPDSSSASSNSDSDESIAGLSRLQPGKTVSKQPQKSIVHRDSPSPPPQPVELPSFLPANGQDDPQKEQKIKEKFRKFWLSAVADGFKDDLEEIRKEPNLSTSRLGLLIDSLASGSDVFTSESMNGIKEYEIILE